jgi:D-alanyl-D-alanine carboxypeptidase
MPAVPKRAPLTAWRLILVAGLAGLAGLAAASPASARGRQEPLHPGFTLHKGDVPRLVQNLPGSSAGLVGADPAAFLARLVQVLAQPQDLLALVDKSHPLSKGFVPPDLVPLSQYPLAVTKPGLELRAVLILELLEMTKASAKEGVTLELSSAYRSYARQAALLEENLKTKSAEEVARTLAPPGHSQHQLGTAIDFGSIETSFASTPAGRWLDAQAWRYGFSLSYPDGEEQATGYSWEPWHFRYVGKDAAALIHDYFADSQQRFLAWYALEKSYLEEHRVGYGSAGTRSSGSR